MPKNLREKVAMVLEDTRTVSRELQIDRLMRVFIDELELLEAEHLFDVIDINHVKTLALEKYNALQPKRGELGYIASDPDMIRTLCLMQGMVGMLRAKGLIKFTMKYRKD